MDKTKWMKAFLEVWHDMCKSTPRCSECRVKNVCPGFFGTITQEFIDEVEEWNEEREFVKEMTLIEGA